MAGTDLVSDFAAEVDSREGAGASVRFDSGSNPEAAAALAKSADVAIVFAYQWESEGMDLESLSLPEHQDELIAKVAAANPHTVVVLETCNPVTMPWANQVSAILEAWYAGSRGAEAVANILFGDVNPSAKLPITFPKSVPTLPHPKIVQPPPESIPNYMQRELWNQIATGLAPFQVTYDEGVKVGYKWYDAENKPVLFPFGYRSFLHDVCLLESEGDAGKESASELHRQQYGQSRRSRNRRSVRFPSRGSCRAAETAGGLEQGEAECGREQGSDG